MGRALLAGTARRFGLRARLTALVLLAALPAFGLAHYVAAEARHRAALYLQDEALRLAERAAAEQEAVVEATRQLLSALAAVPGLRSGGDCGAMLAAVAGNSRYQWIGVLDAAGRPLCSAPTTARGQAEEPWFRRALADAGFTLADSRHGAAGKAALMAALPLVGADGKPDGVIAAAIDLAWLSRQLGDPERPDAGVTIVDTAGTVLARTPDSPAWIGRDLSADPVVAQALRAGHGKLLDAGLGHDRRAFGFVRPGRGEATLVVGVPVEQAFAEADAIYRRTITVMFLIGVLVLALALVGAERLILAPMRILARAAQTLSRGDLHARTGLPHGLDEFGLLAASFDSMAASVEDMVLARTEALRHSQAELDRARAAAEHADRTKTEFLAAASHDLRQPLQAMNLYVHLLRAKLSTPEQKTLVELVAQSAEAACRLVDTLMGMSALETGRVKPNVQRVAVAGLLHRIAEEARGEASAKGLRLRVHARDATVTTDPVLLERMLRNLVKNAVRYTEKGGILVAARRDGAGCRLEVWDTGPGIPADKLEAIFQDFYQLPAARARGEAGLGLGLSTVARMGRLLGHETGVRSRLGRGSTFFIRIPADERRMAA